MRNACVKAGVCALSMLMICACWGCTPSRTALQQAAAEQGRARAQVVLPVLPGECRRAVAHSVTILGANPVIVLARERAQLNLANDVIARCAGFYEQVKTGLERPQQ